MPRTLLLALIATAMSTCTRSAVAEGAIKAPNNIRKLPLSDRRRGEENPDQGTREVPAVTH
ncbi:MAG TPA: hypothetical protein VLC92_16755 [Rhodocyclaceae bacterium]|nr:hypothetical protein [Rhodocyclaceae bacterium]